MLEAVKVWPGKGGACCKVGVTANLDSSCARRHERSHHWEEEVDSQIKNQTMEKNAPPCLNFLTKKAPYKGLGADSEEKHEPVSDIYTAAVDSLKVLDPKRPIREADIGIRRGIGQQGPIAVMVVPNWRSSPVASGKNRRLLSSAPFQSHLENVG